MQPSRPSSPPPPQARAQASQVVVTRGADFSWRNEYAPGTIVTAFGNFAGVPSSATAQALPLPTTLGGVTVSFEGTLAPLVYVSKTQINCVIPDGLTQNKIYTVSYNDGATTQAGSLKVVGSSLRVFTAGQGNFFVGQYVTVDASGQQVYTDLYTLDGQGRLTPNAPPASTAGVYLVLYGTGYGSGTMTGLLVSGTFLNPLYAGASPNYQGLSQFNSRLPDNFTANDILTAHFLADPSGVSQ